MIYDAYHALANAIVMQAVKDYQTALKYDDTTVKNECERYREEITQKGLKFI